MRSLLEKGTKEAEALLGNKVTWGVAVDWIK